jgi:hypothetical protein
VKAQMGNADLQRKLRVSARCVCVQLPWCHASPLCGIHVAYSADVTAELACAPDAQCRASTA